MKKTGHVTRWNAQRAFGFIRSPDTAADVFFHLRDFQGSTPPQLHLEVTFEEIHTGGKGPRAVAVQPVGGTLRPPAVPAAAHPARGTSSARRGQPQPANRPATHPRPLQRKPPGAAAQGRLAMTAWMGVLMLAWAALVGWCMVARDLPWWTAVAACGVNVVTWFAYALDKTAAQQGRWRIAENHLHALALAGGWPGAWLAQRAFRHKTSKPAFRAVFWLTVVVHCAALAGWAAGLLG